MNQPDISIVIPVYNRGRLIAGTLASVERAAQGLWVETVVVDDGSSKPLAEDLKEMGIEVSQLIRQENKGLLFARLAGLHAARGRLILFLDSDDFISSDKLRLHIEAMQEDKYDVTYTDVGHVDIAQDGSPVSDVQPSKPFPNAQSSPDFFLFVQPAPHSPVFDAGFLRTALETERFPPRSAYNPVAEIWLYHKASVLPARVKRLPGPHAIVGRHGQGRITDHWERLGMASLGVMEHFLADTPDGPHASEARARVSCRAFKAWRKHPYGMPRALQRRFIQVWKSARDAKEFPEGGEGFRKLSMLLGPLAAAWLLRRITGKPYNQIRTLNEQEMEALLLANPPPIHSAE